MGCSPGGREESDTTERLHFHFSLSCIREGNGNPLQCSCLENPRDGGACGAAVYGVAQSRTRLKWLSSSSSSKTLLFLALPFSLFTLCNISDIFPNKCHLLTPPTFYYENFKTYKNFEGLIHGTPALYPLPLVLLYLFYHISVHPSIHPAILIGDAFPRSKLQTWEHFTLSIPGCILWNRFQHLFSGFLKIDDVYIQHTAQIY